MNIGKRYDSYYGVSLSKTSYLVELRSRLMSITSSSSVRRHIVTGGSVGGVDSTNIRGSWVVQALALHHRTRTHTTRVRAANVHVVVEASESIRIVGDTGDRADVIEAEDGFGEDVENTVEDHFAGSRDGLLSRKLESSWLTAARGRAWMRYVR